MLQWMLFRLRISKSCFVRCCPVLYSVGNAEKQLHLAGIEPPTFGVPAGETSIRSWNSVASKSCTKFGFAEAFWHQPNSCGETKISMILSETPREVLRFEKSNCQLLTPHISGYTPTGLLMILCKKISTTPGKSAPLLQLSSRKSAKARMSFALCTVSIKGKTTKSSKWDRDRYS